MINNEVRNNEPISQFDTSDYDALWDGVTGDIMHKPNGDIPRDPVTFDKISNYRAGQYQACVYSFSISPADSKYGHEIPKCLYF